MHDYLELYGLKKEYNEQHSRIAIFDTDKHIKYIIHGSRVDKYIVDGGKTSTLLNQFLQQQRAKGINYGFGYGFITVDKETSIKIAQKMMQNIPGCQDIFITTGGNRDDEVIGWVSNIRIAKYINT